MLIKNCNRDKLYQEFLDAQISIISAIEDIDGDVFTFADGVDLQLAQSIINAHDATPTASLPSEIDLLKEQLQQMKEENNVLAEKLDTVLLDIFPSLTP